MANCGGWPLGFACARAWLSRSLVDVQDVELGAESASARRAPRAMRSRACGVGADADGDLFRDGPVGAEALAFDVIVEVAVDGAGDALQGHLAQGDEVAATEEVGERAFDAFERGRCRRGACG